MSINQVSVRSFTEHKFMHCNGIELKGLSLKQALSKLRKHKISESPHGESYSFNMHLSDNSYMFVAPGWTRIERFDLDGKKIRNYPV